MKKLFYILPEYYKDTSTHFRYNVELLEEVASQMEVFLFIEKGEEFISPIQKIYVGRFTFFPFRMAERLFIFSLARLRGYRNFYSHYGYLSALVAILICRLSGGRLFFWHCEMRGKYEEKCTLCNLPAKLTKDWPFRLIMRFCTKLVTCSEQMKRYYLETFNVPTKKIKILSNWVNVEKLIPKDKSRGKTILFLHWLSERKGTRILPELFEAVNRKMTGTKFVVVGKGPDFDWLSEAFKHRQIQVEMPGAIANKDILDYLQRADLFINPSREEEFGRVIIEAMAAGLPIVSTKTLGAEAILTKRQKEFVFDYKNPEEGAQKCVEILSDPHLHEALKKEGLERVKCFAKDRIVENFISLF